MRGFSLVALYPKQGAPNKQTYSCGLKDPVLANAGTNDEAANLFVCWLCRPTPLESIGRLHINLPLPSRLGSKRTGRTCPTSTSAVLTAGPFFSFSFRMPPISGICWRLGRTCKSHPLGDPMLIWFWLIRRLCRSTIRKVGKLPPSGCDPPFFILSLEHGTTLQTS